MSDTLKRKLKQVEDDLAQLRSERADKIKARNEAREAFAAAPGYDTNSDEYKTANEAVKAVGEVDEQINEAQAAQVGILKMLGQSDNTADGNVTFSRQKAEGLPAESDIAKLVQSDAFKSLGQLAHTKSRFGNVALGQLPSDYAFKADVAGGANARTVSVGPIGPVYRPLGVLDLISTSNTTGDTVKYVQMLPGASVAAAVAEGVAKPNASATLQDAQADIDTIAAYFKVHKQVLADAAAVQGILEGQLRFDVRAALEAAVLAEILGTAGIGTTANAAEPLADLISHSMTDVVLSGFQPDAVVLNPSDWESIRLSKDGNQNYQFGSPAIAGQTTIFGVPAIPSVGVTAGNALVGAFQAGATLFMRSGMEVLISDSDQDDFIKNRVTILGELRAGTAVWRPGAFSTADLAA